MSFIYIISHIRIKYYEILAFLCGYFCIYLVSIDLISHSREGYSTKENNSSSSPFNYDYNMQSSDSPIKHIPKQSANKSRILCWIMTSPDSFDTKDKHIKATWGRYCDILLFMSSKSEDTLPVIGLSVNEGRSNLWNKTKAAFYYVYKHYYDKADWFLKADDDTFVSVDNLRRLLDKHSPHSPVYFGRKFKRFVKQGYMSGGAGYVLSHEALRLLIEKGLEAASKKTGFLRNSKLEDVNIGVCLSYAGVKAGDSRDDDHLETFHPYEATLLMTAGLIPTNDWIHSYVYYPFKKGENCCSNHTISFHYVNPINMYVYDYFLNVLEIYGTNTILHTPS